MKTWKRKREREREKEEELVISSKQFKAFADRFIPLARNHRANNGIYTADESSLVMLAVTSLCISFIGAKFDASVGCEDLSVKHSKPWNR